MFSKIFRGCFGRKKYINVNPYEENIFPMNYETSIFNRYQEEYNLCNLDIRINNMCYKWKITRLQALELINNVELRQTREL